MNGTDAKHRPIALPADYDYIACYLTDYCFLKCPYCITDHNDTAFTSGKEDKYYLLETKEWLRAFERIQFPKDVVPTLQGGEPFLYRGIWDLIEHSPVKLDILTALPPVVQRKKFLKLSSLQNLKRNAPYPNVRVSYHIGQNDIEDLAQRVSELQDLISIGIIMVDHPDHPGEADRAREICEKYDVLFKTKEFLGEHNGILYGNYKFEDSCVGYVTRPLVHCRNSVLIVAPNGDVYRCHSDLYHKRQDLIMGNIAAADFQINAAHQPCHVYGLCSECDVKIKTNHNQQYGYTSVDIQFPETTGDELFQGRDRLQIV